MQYYVVAKTGWEISSVSMGCWALGNDYGDISDADADRVVGAALDAGVNFFDTADGYGAGLSEQRLGRALRGKRDKAFIATKAGRWAMAFKHPIKVTHPLHVIEFCHASLFRLQCDYIDLYQCHLGDPEHPEIYIEAFEKLKEDGLIRAYGISGDSLQGLQRFAELGDCASLQLNYNLLGRESAEKKLLPYCLEHNIACLVRGPLNKGMLTGKFTRESQFADRPRVGWSSDKGRQGFLNSLERVEKLRPLANDRRSLGQAAIRFVIEHPAVTCAIPGMKNIEQVHSNCAAADMPWTAADQVIADSIR